MTPYFEDRLIPEESIEFLREVESPTAAAPIISQHESAPNRKQRRAAASRNRKEAKHGNIRAT